MKNQKFWLLLPFTLWLGAGLSAQEPERFALVIGNAAYGGEATLANPANDATDIAEALGTIGWKVTKLIDGDRKQMNRVLVDFKKDLETAEHPVALLYYAGHGIQIAGQNYLIPVRETFEIIEDVQNDSLSLQTVLETFEDANVSVNVVILDACRDNPFAKRNSRTLGGTRGLNVISRPSNVEGSAIMFATAPGDTAADGTGRNGVYTQALLKYLKSDLPLPQLATRVTKEVKLLTGGKQSPYNSMSLSEDFYLVPADLRGAEAEVLPEVVTALTKSPPMQSNEVPNSVLERRTLGSWLLPSGWLLGASGAGLAGYGYYALLQAAAEYKVAESAGVQAQFDAARQNKISANQLLNIGLGVLAVGASALVTSLLVGN